MLFTQKQNLSEMIVGYLAYQPFASLEELQLALEPLLDRLVTKRGWYKAIRLLLELEVIIKIKKQYSLNIAWAHNVM